MKRDIFPTLSIVVFHQKGGSHALHPRHGAAMVHNFVHNLINALSILLRQIFVERLTGKRDVLLLLLFLLLPQRGSKRSWSRVAPATRCRSRVATKGRSKSTGIRRWSWRSKGCRCRVAAAKGKSSRRWCGCCRPEGTTTTKGGRRSRRRCSTKGSYRRRRSGIVTKGKSTTTTTTSRCRRITAAAKGKSSTTRRWCGCIAAAAATKGGRGTKHVTCARRNWMLRSLSLKNEKETKYELRR
mmetsp:Transcript_23601/g.44909  ORF Transcript_23601/g.44909 Transcript_23601/m.44909 type:complete len:241 (+) Transcript_23601:892-1614(+)